MALSFGAAKKAAILVWRPVKLKGSVWVCESAPKSGTKAASSDKRRKGGDRPVGERADLRDYV
jgi:hypothetical protein